MITKEQLKLIGANETNSSLYIDSLKETLIRYEINTKARICQFIAQLYVESDCLSSVKENLNYSCESLLVIFPSKFKILSQTIGLGRSKDKAANQDALDKFLYNGYRGRGLIQITGIDNYKSVSKSLEVDFVNNPSRLEQPKYACLSAGFYWNSIKANSIADIDNEQAVRTITRLVNGPKLVGLDRRIEFWNKAKQVL